MRLEKAKRDGTQNGNDLLSAPGRITPIFQSEF
jgi:hypothetical protein